VLGNAGLFAFVNLIMHQKMSQGLDKLWTRMCVTIELRVFICFCNSGGGLNLFCGESIFFANVRQYESFEVDNDGKSK